MNILITGANKGLGYHLATRLGEAGHSLFLVARNEEKIKEATEKLLAQGYKAEYFCADVSKYSEAQGIAAHWKHINFDGIVNNAGVLLERGTSLLSPEPEILEHSIQTNALSALYMIKTLKPLMAKGCRIVNMSSSMGQNAHRLTDFARAYSISKTIMNLITRHLAEELYAEGIIINSMCPGWVRTEMGGSEAPRNLDQGVDTAIWLLTQAPATNYGKFYRDRAEIDW